MSKEKKYYDTGETKWYHGQKRSYDRDDWHSLLGPCPICGTPCFDYGGGWRCQSYYCNNSYTNPTPNLGKEPEWWNKGINVMVEGNMWFAHDENFINLQESQVAFGKTPGEAAIDFLNGKKS